MGVSVALFTGEGSGWEELEATVSVPISSSSLFVLSPPEDVGPGVGRVVGPLVCPEDGTPKEEPVYSKGGELARFVAASSGRHKKRVTDVRPANYSQDFLNELHLPVTSRRLGADK